MRKEEEVEEEKKKTKKNIEQRSMGETVGKKKVPRNHWNRKTCCNGDE